MPSGGLYATYHLLGEPETTIESYLTQPFRIMKWNSLNFIVPTKYRDPEKFQPVFPCLAWAQKKVPPTLSTFFRVFDV